MTHKGAGRPTRMWPVDGPTTNLRFRIARIAKQVSGVGPAAVRITPRSSPRSCTTSAALASAFRSPPRRASASTWRPLDPSASTHQAQRRNGVQDESRLDVHVASRFLCVRICKRIDYALDHMTPRIIEISGYRPSIGLDVSCQDKDRFGVPRDGFVTRAHTAYLALLAFPP